MAYIGTPVQQALTKVTSQSFNGTGSQTVFTLNRAVNTGEELEVFVNNVQQEPGVGKSYTATGTTLTFDAAPSSGTGNIYVIYRGLAEVTRRLEHDPNAALAATTGTFSDGITVDKNGATVATFDRATSDGSIVDFQKSGTTVGIIGNTGTEMYIGTPSGSDGFIRFQSLGIVPSTSTGANSDGTMQLGTASGRFSDLYLSGGVYLGGVSAPNKLDDYERGAWTPVDYYGAVSFTVYEAYYTKIGRKVFFELGIAIASNSTSNTLRIAGLPFAALTGNDDTGGAFLVSTNSGRSDLFLVSRGNTFMSCITNSNVDVFISSYSNKQLKLNGSYIAN